VLRSNGHRSKLKYLASLACAVSLACVVSASGETPMHSPRLGNRGAEREGNRASPSESSYEPMRGWAFITSHARVLLAIARNPELRVEEIAMEAGITERSVYRIIADLVEGGYLRRSRTGTRNQYEIEPDLPLGDPVMKDHAARDLLALISK
jgi:MarR family protein